MFYCANEAVVQVLGDFLPLDDKLESAAAKTRSRRLETRYGCITGLLGLGYFFPDDLRINERP